MLDQMNEIDSKNLNFAAKKQVIKSFRAQEDKVACKSIIEFLYDENKSIQEFAMDALIQIGNKEVIESLLPLLQNNDVKFRNTAMEIIREIAFDKIFLLTPLLHDSSEPIRIYVADLLGLVGNIEAINPLISCLQDPSANVRSSAVAGLGKISNEKAIEAIEKLMEKEEELWVIFSAIKSLEHIGGKKSIQILIKFLEQENEFILSAAIESLGEIGDMETIHSILKKMPSPSENIIERINAAFMSIVQRQNCSIPEEYWTDLISFFILCAKSQVNIWTRFRAIEFLGKLQTKESLPTLAEIAQNAPPMLKIAAARAMGNIGGQESKKILTLFTKSDDPNIKEVAEESLKRLD